MLVNIDEIEIWPAYDLSTVEPYFEVPEELVQEYTKAFDKFMEVRKRFEQYLDGTKFNG